MPQLQNIRQERFARFVAKGLTKTKAYTLAGYVENRANAIKLWRHSGKASESIQRRVKELIKDSSKLSTQDILDHIYATFELAFESGQCSAALKACEMLGKERGLFRDRRENININLAAMNWTQIEQHLMERYGNKATPLIDWLKNSYCTTATPELIDNNTSEL